MAYISAVAARAGFDCSNPHRHDYGADLQINLIEIDEDGDRDTCGMPLRIQAKASFAFDDAENGFISYRLKRKSYNKLVKDTGNGPPYILVLYCMPSDENEWLNIYDHQYAVLKQCGYWISLRGLKRLKGEQSITIKISKEDVFNGSSLTQIMKTIQIPGAHL